jgi:two-component system, chemotaxis family, protein-glutamate methylesterase/glutaminase
MHRKIRVLIVDDSVVMRRFLAHALEDDPAFEVAGFAANGLLALNKVAELNPDAITMDIEMPEMDGLTTVCRLRELGCKARIVMCSTLTTRGATSTIDALMHGANDYVTKPAGSDPTKDAFSALRDDLIPKLKQFFLDHPAPSILDRARNLPAKAIAWPAARVAERTVVAIGVSTGGPTALLHLLPQFPKIFPLPMVIVQHMPPIFTKQLAERLNAESALGVFEATHGMTLEPGRALLAPGDYHMRVKRAADRVSVVLDQQPRENSCRPAVDVLFRSVAEVYGAGALGVILTGMGQDGLLGARQLKAHGARVVVQDRESSVVWGMPGAVADAGLADAVLSLSAMAQEILRQVPAL